MSKQRRSRFGHLDFAALNRTQRIDFGSVHTDVGHSDEQHSDHSDAELPFTDSHRDHDDWRVDSPDEIRTNPAKLMLRILELEQWIADLERRRR